MKKQADNKLNGRPKTKRVGVQRRVRPFWNVRTIPVMTIEAFAKKNGLRMTVHERQREIGDHSRFYALFDGAEVSLGGMLRGEFGNGATAEEAAAAYSQAISMKRLVIDAFTKARKEIDVPRLSA